MNEDFLYIAKCKCGCGGIVVLIVDDDKSKKFTAREVSKLIREGYKVERILADEIKSVGCKNKMKQGNFINERKVLE